MGEEVKIASVVVTFEQGTDCCQDSDDILQWLEVATQDGGGGVYYTLKTERWAISDIGEVLELLRTVEGFIAGPARTRGKTVQSL